MEEGKEALVPSTTVPKMTASSVTNGFQHGASKVATGSPKNLSTLMISPVISKQPLLNGTSAGASSVKSPNISSAVSLPPFGSADIKMGVYVNGSNFIQNRGAEAIKQSNKSGHHTASSSRASLQSSSQAEKYVDTRGHAIYPLTGTVVGYQAPKGELSVQTQSIFSNHKAIAKNVEWILHQPAKHSTWSVPSIEYMNTKLDCQLCKVPITNMESLFVCDACERGMHIKCLQYYENQGLPKTEWYCPTCVAHSNGKPLPPKYGKVARNIVAPKTCMTSGAQPSQGAAENPTEKDGICNKNVAANGSVVSQNTNKVGNAVCESGTLALDATGSKLPSISSAEPRKEDVKHDETSSVEKKGNDLPCGGIPKETATMSNEVQRTGASTYYSGNLSVGSHDIESSSANPVIYQADGVTNDGIGKPHKHKTMADDAISDHGNAHQVTLNGHVCSEPQTIGGHDGYVGSSTASIVDWVGDGLRSIDNKTYYNSCNVDGIIYNLHDHILIASEGSKSCPCKLQSLWEEHDSGSRLAMVNTYFFGSDIPESISKPCIDEEDEVYGLNNERIVLISAIRGPCEVLHVDKFREETKRRCHLDSSDFRLHPVFFFRWNYDDSTSSFYKDYNVDN